MIRINMDLPKTCMDCRFNRDNTWCIAVTDEGLLPDDYGEKRANFCPLNINEEAIPINLRNTKMGMAGQCPVCKRAVAAYMKHCAYCTQELKWPLECEECMFDAPYNHCCKTDCGTFSWCKDCTAESRNGKKKCEDD